MGDQLTCKNIRGAKRWRETEIGLTSRLRWANEVPGRLNHTIVITFTYNKLLLLIHAGDFHFLWECLRVIFHIFWGSPAFPGSLCNLREHIHRVRVTREVRDFSVGDEFLMHTFISHLLTAICSVFHIQSPHEPIPHECSKCWLETTAKSIVAKVLNAPS